MAYLKDGIIKSDTQTPGLQEAKEKLDYMRMSEKERREYEDYMVSVHAYNDVMDTAKEEGRAEGMAQGMAQGMAEGRAEERERAMEEKRDSARKMKADNMPPELIIKYTGLTAEEIAAL